MTQLYSAILVSLLLLIACNDKPIPPNSSSGNGSINDTLYIPLQPDWTGFNEPSDIYIGREPFVYIADTKNNQIVMLDISGRKIGNSLPIKNPKAISQDGLFDLLISAELDTVLQGKSLTVGAIFRIHMSKALHNISNAEVSLAYCQPSRIERRFTGITCLPDNSYIVSRTGPNNSSKFDPDDAILIFSSKDSLTGRLSSLIPEGNALYSIGKISSVSVAADRSSDIIFTQISQEMQFKVQWLSFLNGDITGWFQKFNPADNLNSGRDLLALGKFTCPEDITYDSFGNIYIADAIKDSVFKFNSYGKEMQSFGGYGSSLRQFSAPSGIAWFNKTLFVADTKNHRICRFRLSTD